MWVGVILRGPLCRTPFRLSECRFGRITGFAANRVRTRFREANWAQRRLLRQCAALILKLRLFPCNFSSLRGYLLCDVNRAISGFHSECAKHRGLHGIHNRELRGAKETEADCPHMAYRHICALLRCAGNHRSCFSKPRPSASALTGAASIHRAYVFINHCPGGGSFFLREGRARPL